MTDGIMNISIDAMGGDNAPKAIVEGCLLAIEKRGGYRLKLIGDQSKISGTLEEHKYSGDRIEVVNATQTIDGDEMPTRAIKEKKDSPIVIGLNLLNDNGTDSFLSCGNSGALLTGSMLITGRIKGVDRPALAPFVPTVRGVSVLIDAGLNMSCKPINYEQFATIGTIFARTMLDIESPRVGLLNVGTEENKGTETVKEAHNRLAALGGINFIGNIEGRDLTEGMCDVAVCDGFVGNLVLKCYEGIGAFVFNGVAEVFRKNVVNKIAASILRKDMRSFFKKFDYEEYGGTPILGVGGSVFKVHGNANAKTVMYAIDRAVSFARTKTLDQIRDCFATAGAAADR
jgi:glycerol-3-phosphate acyltransferase PlsX